MAARPDWVHPALSCVDGSVCARVDGGHTLGSPEERATYLEDCGVRGVSFGGDDTARKAAFAAVDGFLAERIK